MLETMGLWRPLKFEGHSKDQGNLKAMVETENFVVSGRDFGGATIYKPWLKMEIWYLWLISSWPWKCQLIQKKKIVLTASWKEAKTMSMELRPRSAKWRRMAALWHEQLLSSSNVTVGAYRCFRQHGRQQQLQQHPYASRGKNYIFSLKSWDVQVSWKLMKPVNR